MISVKFYMLKTFLALNLLDKELSYHITLFTHKRYDKKYYEKADKQDLQSPTKALTPALVNITLI